MMQIFSNRVFNSEYDYEDITNNSKITKHEEES